jgi:hypothetical protein
MHRAVVVMIRRNRNEIFGKNETFRFPKQRHKHQRGEGSTLKGDGNRQSAPANAALARALFWIAFEETATERTKGFFGITLKLKRHHTPPHGIAARGTGESCSAGFLWIALQLRETGAALAGM